MTASANFQKFRIVMWKNFILISRNKISALKTLSLPIGSIGLLILLRYMLADTYEKSPAKNYAPLGLHHQPDVNDFPATQLAYYPKNYSKEMDAIGSRLNLQAFGFDSKDDLHGYISNNSKTQGVLFQLDQKSNTLNVVLTSRFTGFIEDLREESSLIKNYKLADGGSPYYMRGFTYMQQALFEAFFSNPNNVTIMLNRFPIQSFVNDQFLIVLLSMGSILAPMSFALVYMNNMKHIIEEKESQLKEMMLIMGLPNWIDWWAWFSKIMLENIIIAIIITFLLKYPITAIPCIQITSGLLVFVVIAVFIVSMTTFSMMTSVFFKDSKRANMIGIIIYMASLVPVLFAFVGGSTTTMSILGLLLSPSAFGYAFRSIVLFEQFGIGMQWRYLFTSVPGDLAFPLFYYLLAMLLSNLVHILIMLYVEAIYPGEFGSPRPWYFPIEGLLKRRDEYMELGNASHSSHTAAKCEQPPSDATPGIQITHLTKRFNQFTAVNDLTLTINENEIMVLLGENGAGKSTTMSMLTGVIPPTSGTARIYRKDIRTDMKSIREKIGLCPQKNVLFHQLTVLEHMLFFGQLKGLSKEQAQAEATEFIDRLSLAGKEDELSHTLSGGMKRKLNLAIAFAGHTKAVFLDEPTSGVDPASRRDIWKILQEEKQHRMILLSTHFMDEADVLGDRVAILTHGELKCTGSAFYLKNTFHSTYKLTCALREGFKVDPVLSLIKKYIPDATLKDNYGMEYHFDLNPKYLSAFGDLFKRFESSDNIGLASFGIELPTLEDVFLKIQRDMDQPDAANYHRLEMDSDLIYEPLTGTALQWNWFVATVKKQYYYTIRNIFMYIVRMAIPAICVGISLLMHRDPPEPDDRIVLSLDAYGRDLISLVEVQEGSNPTLVDSYKALLKPYGGATETQYLNNYIQDLDISGYEKFKSKAVVGARFTSNNTVLAMFNNQAGHAIPIALTLVYNAIIAASQSNYPQLAFTYERWVKKNDSDSGEPINAGNAMYSSLLYFALNMAIAYVGTLHVVDRYSGALSIMFISGMHPIVYWIYTFLLDLIPYIISIVAVVVIYIVADMGETETLPQLFLIMFLYGVAVLPLIYLRARRYKTGANLSDHFINMSTIFMIAYFVVTILKMTDNYKDLGKSLHSVLLVVPFYNLFDSVSKYDQNVQNPFPETRKTFTQNYMYFGGSAVFFFCVLFLHDLRLLNWLYAWLEGPVTEPLGELEEDVLAEMNKVDAMTQERIDTHLLVAKHLGKTFKKKAAVRDVTFILERGECLGLLGKNGAGKTTTFRMLTGEEVIREGDAWLDGVSIKNNLLKTYSNFGYCPQVDSVLEDLTGLESMELICLVRGVPTDRIDHISKSLAFKLGFNKHMNKLASQMSGGNKRKLCTALALIGTPQLVYMDEPTTGMDPMAKRSVWDVMGKYRQAGHSVILTTHSMEECEALCTRLVILKDGKIEAIGSGYHLKQKYARTGHLVVQLERSRAKDKKSAVELGNFLNGQLRGLNLKQEYQGKLEFEFNPTENLSKLFILMESIKKKYSIESYAVSNQNTLDNVFLEFVSDD